MNCILLFFIIYLAIISFCMNISFVDIQNMNITRIICIFSFCGMTIEHAFLCLFPMCARRQQLLCIYLFFHQKNGIGNLFYNANFVCILKRIFFSLFYRINERYRFTFDKHGFVVLRWKSVTKIQWHNDT